jgi:hypothetical protein
LGFLILFGVTSLFILAEYPVFYTNSGAGLWEGVPLVHAEGGPPPQDDAEAYAETPNRRSFCCR